MSSERPLEVSCQDSRQWQTVTEGETVNGTICPEMKDEVTELQINVSSGRALVTT